MVHILNDFMKANRNAPNDILESYMSSFNDCISEIYKLYGQDVFRTNIQTHQISQKFYATVFDAVMLATSYALCCKADFNVFTNSAERLKLLFSNEDFLLACNAHTTEKAAILTRVGKACKILYDLDYEKRI